MKKRKIILIIVAILVLGIAAGIFAMVTYVKSFDKRISEVTVTNVDLNKIPDGTYTGSCKVFPVEATVEVTVESHKIISINLIKHVNGQGKPAEVIPDKVVQAQSLDVDAISGATFSSKVILKAIENALSSVQK